MELRSQQKDAASSTTSFCIAWCGILVVMVYTAWVWAGLRPSFHRYGFWLAVAIGSSWLIAGPSTQRKALLLDPVFTLGMLFIGLLFLQWWNSGRELVFDEDLFAWIYSLPPYPNLPFSFTQPEAWQMITWFLPAWVILLIVRSPAMRGAPVRRLLFALSLSAGLLAVFGLVQWFSGTRQVYWVTPFRASFFASFAYRNHAASYFSLMACVAAALLMDQTSSRTIRPRSVLTSTALALSLVFSLLGLIFCGSRAGMGFAVLLILVLGGVFGERYWRHSTTVRRFHMAAASVAVLGLMIMAVILMDAERLPHRVTPLAWQRMTRSTAETGELDLSLSPEVRMALYRASVAIWRQHPWFGVGGWGFRYLLAFQLPEEQWGLVTRSGRANVHNDFLQYLAEFGVLGMGFILALLIVIMNDFRRAGGFSAPEGRVLSLGLGLVLIHSLIDLPFRSPAILYTWLATLAAFPMMKSAASGRGVCANLPTTSKESDDDA